MTDLDDLSLAVHSAGIQTRRMRVPRYGGVALMSFIVRGVGVLKVLIGGLILYIVLSPHDHRSSTVDLFQAMYLLPIGLGLLIGGFVLYVAGQALAMLRDIARNSFR